MKKAILVQARMSSQRLPGKVLRTVRGRPLLAYLLERLAQADFQLPVLVATSTDQSDDAIADFCRQHGTDCWRGSLTDVAGRFLQIADSMSLDAFVRISGDSPLLDMSIVQGCLERFRQVDCDLATNVFPRTFPRGQSAEVLRVSTFRQAYGQMSEPEDLEHVTRHYYRHPDRFKIENVVSHANYGSRHMAVDSPEDFESLKQIVEAMQRPQWTYSLAEIAELYQRTELAVGTT